MFYLDRGGTQERGGRKWESDRRGAEGSLKDPRGASRLADVHPGRERAVSEAGTGGAQKGLQETELINTVGGRVCHTKPLRGNSRGRIP